MREEFRYMAELPGTPPEQAGFSVSVYSRDERTDVADVTVSLMQYE